MPEKTASILFRAYCHRQTLDEYCIHIMPSAVAMTSWLLDSVTIEAVMKIYQMFFITTMVMVGRKKMRTNATYTYVIVLEVPCI